MRAITLWQPWASLLACGAKQFETRSWGTQYRGPIAIHAAAKNPNCADIFGMMSEDMIDSVREALGIVDFAELPRGAIIATAELVGCWPTVAPARIEGMVSTGKMIKAAGPVSVHGNELQFGDWTPGRYAWEFANMKMLDKPVPAKGGQRIWNWEAHR